jgi:hypothetical protein
MSGWFRGIQIVKETVAESFAVPETSMVSPRRAMQYALPRMVAMAVARDLVVDASLPLIGSLFGGRDHTTVMHAVARVAELCRKDAAFAQTVAELSQLCAARIGDTVEPSTEAQATATRLVEAICAQVREGLLKVALKDPVDFVRAATAGEPIGRRPHPVPRAELPTPMPPVPQPSATPADALPCAARDVPVGQSWAFPKTPPRAAARTRKLDPIWPVRPNFKTGTANRVEAGLVEKENIHDRN